MHPIAHPVAIAMLPPRASPLSARLAQLAQTCCEKVSVTLAAARDIASTINVLDMAVVGPAIAAGIVVRVAGRFSSHVVTRLADLFTASAAYMSQVGTGRFMSTGVDLTSAVARFLHGVDAAVSTAQVHTITITVVVAALCLPIFRSYRRWRDAQLHEATRRRARPTMVVEEFLPPDPTIDPLSPSIETPPAEVEDLGAPETSSSAPLPTQGEADAPETSAAAALRETSKQRYRRKRAAARRHLQAGEKAAVASDPNKPTVKWTQAQRTWAAMPQRARMSSFQLWVARYIRAKKGGPMFVFNEANNCIVRRMIATIFEERHVRAAHYAAMADAVVAAVFTPTSAELAATEAMETQHVVSLPLISQMAWWLRSGAEAILSTDLNLARRWRRLAQADF